MMVGGGNGGTVFKHAFLGEITKDKMDVSWKKLSPMRKRRSWHIAFKILIFAPAETIHLVRLSPALNWSHCQLGTTTPGDHSFYVP